MIALVTQRETENQYGEPSDILMRLNAEYAHAQGFTPLAVPNIPSAARELAGSLDYGFLLVTGGGFASREYLAGDLAGARYQDLRDDVERTLIADAAERGIPILALCRGMFMVNGFFGGKVLRGGSHSAPRHDHYVVFNSGARALVNTYHNSAVPLNLISDELEPLAVEEGTVNVEAYRHRTLPILGLQWHPERGLPSAEAIQATESLMAWLLRGVPLPESIVG